MTGLKFTKPLLHDRFHYRGKELLRIEALSDAVFAFSVSLLVAALEVPQTFKGLITIVQGAVPFFATVALLFLFWYRQYIFFRRYGINDLITIIYNLFYLAIILFYLYPLKFMFSLLIASWTGLNLFPHAHENGEAILTNQEFPQLIILFSSGYCLIWFIYYCMHRRAMQLGSQLHFTSYEKLFTVKEIRGALWNSLIGLFAIVFTLLGSVTLAGITYLFIPFLLLLNHFLFRRQYKIAVGKRLRQT